VQWDAVTEIHADETLYIDTEDGQTLSGPVRTRGDRLVVETASAGTLEAPLASVRAVRSKASQEAYEAEIERLRNPGLLDFWNGFFDAGYSLAQGNANSSTFSTSSKIQRKTQRDKISLYYTQVLARNKLMEGETETTANAIRGGTRYDINVSENMFTYGFVDLEFDEFQALDLRNVLGGGAGWHAIDTETVSFDIFGGAAFNQEFFNDGITRRSGELTVGEELSWELNDRATWTQRFAYYPNLTELGQHRMQFDTSYAMRLNSILSWQISLSDRFISNPALGRKNNDVLLSTGLRLSFGKSKTN
jgi:putative salt-induced outer membrane protein